MKAAELRNLYIEFFKGKGHRVVRSDSLAPPAEDKSVLFTPAGMNQFKNEFMGRGEPGFTRAVTSQKCMRTGDVEKVGRTAWHHTFFEMLGDFSFGDYFKHESIAWAWEFLTEVLKLPPERLRVSVYKDDDEAFDIWEKEIGLSPKVIHRFGEHENFWPADCPSKGPNGLCGPCSEIFYDYGEEVGCGKPDCDPSCECDRFCEIWNLVFQQFERHDGGVLETLPTKNIDTGMGLERTAAVLQGKRTSFDTDLFVPIIEAIEREADKAYAPVRETREGVAFRRIADHARAAVFCLSDGILPGNSGRGYVLRKLIRRAVLDGRRLDMREPFLYRLVPVITQIMGDQYPEVVARRENISRLIRIEEEQFITTLEHGMQMLQDMLEKLRRDASDTLSGADAFRLFDTYGLPLDVTASVLEDEGFGVDRDGFEQEMEGQRALSRKGTRIAEDIFAGGPAAALQEQGCVSEFAGYDEDETGARVIGIICDDELADEISAGAEAIVALDRTSFYAESGGQVGDTGVIEGDGIVFDVSDTQQTESLVLHIGKVRSGVLRQGDAVTAKPDVARRANIRRNHTATHLLHLALREVIGKHAEQSGSHVGPDRLRFDFMHTQAVTREELRLVEDRVNSLVLGNALVSCALTSPEEARAQGAMALFGEKYGEVVRLLNIGGYSRELCGGLHCSATGEIGLVKITAESSVAAGIRRIEAVTGMAAVKLVHEKEDLIRSACEALGAQEAQLAERAEHLNRQVKDLRKELQRARVSKAPSTDEYLQNAKEIGGAKIVAAKVADATADDLCELSDSLRKSGGPVGIVLGAASEGKVALLVAFTKDLVGKGCHAGKIAGAAARLCGGGGGGRPDLAQAGGKDPSGLDKALEKAVEMIDEALGG